MEGKPLSDPEFHYEYMQPKGGLTYNCLVFPRELHIRLLQAGIHHPQGRLGLVIPSVRLMQVPLELGPLIPKAVRVAPRIVALRV